MVWWESSAFRQTGFGDKIWPTRLFLPLSHHTSLQAHLTSRPSSTLSWDSGLQYCIRWLLVLLRALAEGMTDLNLDHRDRHARSRCRTKACDFPQCSGCCHIRIFRGRRWISPSYRVRPDLSTTTSCRCPPCSALSCLFYSLGCGLDLLAPSTSFNGEKKTPKTRRPKDTNCKKGSASSLDCDWLRLEREAGFAELGVCDFVRGGGD